jgi:UDP-glucuronate 4-epimerase
MNILITGVAGFIGYHLAQRFLAEGQQVYGVDNVNDYYDVSLKKARLAQLGPQAGFTFHYLDVGDRQKMLEMFGENKFDRVVHLAAQAGVRYSLENPFAYVDSNLVGFANILEGCRHAQVEHLVFASSSSVYGTNTKIPFSVEDNVDRPVSLYAATKKANELMAHAYSHLYNLPTTGLRFFTVYGPWGRPDMAYFKFVRAIAEDRPIDVYNFGNMKRDFTYIDDVIEGVMRVTYKPPVGQTPYKIYNLGNNSPVALGEFIETIEKAMGKTAIKNFLPMQPGDVPSTYADVDELIKDVGFKPTTSIEQGVDRFVRWYKDYFEERSNMNHQVLSEQGLGVRD